MKYSRMLLGVAMSVVLLSACSSYEDSPLPQEPTTDKPLAMEHVPVEKACTILNGIITSPAVQENTTRGVTVSPTNATAFNAEGEMLTRADNEEARYYLMDIPELGMYAIMGAHTTVPPLLVLANGSATAEPIHEDDELKNYIANLPNTPNNWTIPIDTMPVGPVPVDTTSLNFKTTYVYDYDNATFTLLNGVTPIDMAWGQHSPYNMRCPGGFREDGSYYEHGAVCCGAMSIAMLMTHPKYRPDITINGVKLDWQKMWNFKYENYRELYPERFTGILENHISALFELLSSEKNLNVNWKHEWLSTCYSSDIMKVIQKYGIECTGGHIPYNYESLAEDISNGYPVMIDGYTNEGGHIWICSAILKADIPYKIVPVVNDPSMPGFVIESGIRTFNLLHHNWGWAKDTHLEQDYGIVTDYNGYYFESSEIQSGKGLKFDEDFGLVIRKSRSWGTYSNLHIWKGLRQVHK